jgi:hypothetical protein
MQAQYMSWGVEKLMNALGSGSGRSSTRAKALILAVTGLAVAAMVATAAPVGAALDALWTASGTGEADGRLTVSDDGTNGIAQFTYTVPGSDFADDTKSGEWTFETVAGAPGLRDIDWSYAGAHGRDQVTVGLEAFVTDGTSEQVFALVDDGPVDCCLPPWDAFAYSGTITLDVDEGDSYGFRMSGSFIDDDPADDDDGVLEGTLLLDIEQTDAFTVAVTADTPSVVAGTTVTLAADIQAVGSDQDLDSIYAELSPGLSYVPGSSTLGGGSVALDDPLVGGNTLTWAPAQGFLIDATSGLNLQFDVAVAADYGAINEGFPPATVAVTGVVGTFEASGVGSFAVTDPPSGTVALVQAIPLQSGTKTGIVGTLLTTPDTPGTLQIDHAASCLEGALGADATELGTFDLPGDEDGELFFALAIDNAFPIDGGFVTASFGVGSESTCIVAGPDNDSWTRALPVGLTGGSDSSSGYIDQPGLSRWYKFSVTPGAAATVTLSDLPADYDLAVFKDIAQAYTDLANPLEDLNRLSAEFAPSVFSPSVFSPSVFSPSVFSPDAYAPSVFSPSVFSPSVFSPSVFSPSVFSPSVFSPSVFSPSVFSPSVFSPSVFSGAEYSPSVFSPSVFSPSVFSPSVFSPDAFASAQVRSIIGVSAKAGTGDEIVVANTWTNTGDYYIRVTGRNGAFAVEDSFDVSVLLEDATCDLSQISTFPTDRGDNSSSFDTVILWDSSRIEGDSQERTDLGTRLATLAARPEVDGIVVDIAADAEVNALRTQAAQQTQCVYATNLVAESIRAIVESHRNSDLKYVVLVGGDDSIPFFRYPDQALLGPEQDYDPPVADDSASQAALRLNYILGQDEYGSRFSVSAGDGEIPIPDLAVGRVVETAAEAIGVIDAYLSTADGVALSGAGLATLTTGYDFLTDAAEAVAGNLDAGTAAAGSRLIDPADRSPEDPLSWTAEDLRTSLLNSGRNDLVFLAGHFSANSALAADYRTSLVTTELANSAVDLTNSIVFSAGCHSGYNIVNNEIVPGVTEPLDWAQAFAQKGATLIAGTGYQYGDTDFIEYSERLYAGFSARLSDAGPVSVGGALVDAKQDYLAATPDMRGLHRKALIISTVFGLPMTSVDLPGGPIVGPGDTSIVGTPTVFAAGPGEVLGLGYADVTIAEPLQQKTVMLTQLDGSAPLVATYYEGPNGRVITNPAEPTVPLITKNVTVSGQVLRGVGFRGGDFTDMTGTPAAPLLPLTGAPTTELRGVHTPFASEAFFPMRLATVNYFGELTDEGGLTQLNVTPAQHRVERIGDFNTVLRLYSDLDLRLYYSSNTDTYDGAVPALAGPPTITQVSATPVDADGDGAVDDVAFEVAVVGDPVAGIQEVWVTYTDLAVTTAWQSLDLAQSTTDSTKWAGVLLDGDSPTLEFVAQAANGVGLVTLDDNFGEYYSIAGDLGPFAPATLDLAANGSGSFGSELTASATLTSDGLPVADAAVLFSIGGTNRVGVTGPDGVATAGLPLTSVPGSYQLTASFAGNDDYEPAAASQTFILEKAATSLALTPGFDLVLRGEPTGISATLLGPGGAPLKERTVYFTLSNGTEMQTVAVITNFLGVANLGAVDVAGGYYTVTARFLGEIPFPLGSATLTDPTYLPSADTENLTVIGDGGRATRAALRDYLASLEGTPRTEQRLDAAIGWLEQSLRDEYWSDENSLHPVQGEFVFNRDRKVVAVNLMAIIDADDGLAAEAQLALNALLAADRYLAQTLLDEATAAGGDPVYLERAQGHLDEGDAFAQDGRADKAIASYGKAWEDARNATP